MKQFPDESTMPKSESGDEVIRGGSIGFNRILNRFVLKSGHDRVPEFTAVLISAFTIFRNVLATYPNATIEEIETAFVKDVNLFLDYYDTYLAHTKGTATQNLQAAVVIYFPTYVRVEKELLREETGRKLELQDKYKKFLARYNGQDEMVKRLDHVRCFWVGVGSSTYPHRDVVRKFREIVGSSSLYHQGDKIALITHIPLDYHLAARLRNVWVLESFTAEFKSSDQFRMKLDKEGRIPFNTVCHVVFGDGVLVRPMVSGKFRKALFEQAQRERWVGRAEEELVHKIAKTAEIPLKELRRYNFV